MRFSAHLYKTLSINVLQLKQHFLYSKFHIPYHETCLIEMRKTIFRNAKHAQTRRETCPTASRNISNGEWRATHRQRNTAKTTFSLSNL